MKKKTFVITVSKTFPAYHPKAGQLTYFKDKILSGEKIHTIRSNEELWADRIRQVNIGIAELALREWIDMPYRSKQNEFLRLSKAGFQPFDMDINGVIAIDRFYTNVDYDIISKNDGLNNYDLFDWFKYGKQEFSGGIIQFTDFLYE